MSDMGSSVSVSIWLLRWIRYWRRYWMGVEPMMVWKQRRHSLSLTDALEAAYEAASAGVDALIIADLGAAALIRATEATVVERIPPRVAIRSAAPLELPHVMLLMNEEDTPLAVEDQRLAQTVAGFLGRQMES